MLLASTIFGYTALDIIIFLAGFICLLFVLPLHEFAHAFAAVKNGDDTPKIYNRYTIYPFAHFDVLGLALFLVAGFGWAKPVPVNPNNFKKYKKGCIEVSLAGVIMNYIVAFVCYPLFILCARYLPDILLFDELITYVFYLGYLYSLSFCVFNLLPFYPLDGFNFIDSLFNHKGKVLQFLRQYGNLILIILIVINMLSERIAAFNYINLLGWIMIFARNIFSWPIRAFWGLIL